MMPGRVLRYFKWILLFFGFPLVLIATDPKDFYLTWAQERTRLHNTIKNKYGSSWDNFDPELYHHFLTTLDLASEVGLMHWSVVTGIPIVAVNEDSDFFYYNRHLLPEEKRATKWHSTRFERSTSSMEWLIDGGNIGFSISLPKGIITEIETIGSISFNKGFAEDQIHWDLLDPFLTTLDQIPHRKEIGDGIARLPLSIVKVLRGKALYLSIRSGRSYTASGPLGNEIYNYFAGLQPGAFIEVRAAEHTAQVLVHEVGHLIHHAVVEGRYGNIFHPYQFPQFQKLLSDTKEIFGKDSYAKFPDVTHGFFSPYSKVNNQENFADHFMAYIMFQEKFEKQAREEEELGHPLLIKKYRFMQKLMEATPPTYVKLSRDFISKYEKPFEMRERVGSKTSIPEAEISKEQDRACWEDLHDLSRIQRLLETKLSVPVACRVSNPTRVPLTPNQYYYVGDLRCHPQWDAKKSALADLTDAMEKESFYGYKVELGGQRQVIVAQTSTRVCSSY